MADVFISYAREEHDQADTIRRALEELGLDVFMDVERLDAGDVFTDVVEREVKSALSVIGVWSPYALSRKWVRIECDIGRERGVLLPVLIKPIRALDTPAPFWNTQHVDLTDFEGQHDHPGWRKLLRALGKTLKRDDLIKADDEIRKKEERQKRIEAELAKKQREMDELRKKAARLEAPRRRRTGAVIASLAVIALAAGAGAWWWGDSRSEIRAAEARREIISAAIGPEVRRALDQLADDSLKSSNHLVVLNLALRQTTLQQLELAAEVGDGDAALLAGWAHKEGRAGETVNNEIAVQFFRRSCELKNMRGCRNLGIAYATGEGVAFDPVQAVQLYQMACDGDDIDACVNLGQMYDDGQGAPEDNERAVQIFEPACKSGKARACFSLGLMYERGEVPSRQGSDALPLYQEACQTGAAEACELLADRYRFTDITNQNLNLAAEFYKRACDNGRARSCGFLGSMYFDGEGVEQNNAIGFGYWRQACDAGEELFCDLLEEQDAEL